MASLPKMERLADFARVGVDVKLCHQKSLNSSLKHPCSSTKSLYRFIAARFSSAHCSALRFESSSFRACSKVADKLIFSSRLLRRRSLLMERFAAFFSAAAL